MAAIDPRNVQGIVLNGYTFPVARFFLCQFADAARATQWVDSIASRVTLGTPWDLKPASVLTLGFTFAGLQALKLPIEILDEFPVEFQLGPGGLRAEAKWDTRVEPTLIHAMVAVHAQDEQSLRVACNFVLSANEMFGVVELPAHNAEGAPLQGKWVDDKVHFGFRDGISQPDVFWKDEDKALGKVDFRQFVLGYATVEVPSKPDKGLAQGFARDGSYMAFTVIYQNVAAFENFLTEQAEHIAPKIERSVGDTREWLAAKMMGRWRNGVPVAMSDDGQQHDLKDANDFKYASDPRGEHCPLQAHVRVTNPRDQLLTPIEMGSIPRLIRRGIPYGDRLAQTQDDGKDRGLIGMFICSSLARQFVKQSEWINRTDFSPLFHDNEKSGQDAVMGNRNQDATNQFKIRIKDSVIVLQKLPQFLKPKGSLYLFLPGTPALASIRHRELP